MTAATPGEALRCCAEQGRQPDLIVADYHLDEGTGLEAVAAIRDRFDAEVPAVLITADRSAELRDMAAVMNIRVLSKPVKAASLRAILAQLRVSRVAAE